MSSQTNLAFLFLLVFSGHNRVVQELLEALAHLISFDIGKTQRQTSIGVSVSLWSVFGPFSEINGQMALFSVGHILSWLEP